jgi:hypothetical protein
LDPSQAASTPPEAPQLATTPTAAPKKKKKKPKKKKKSITPASESAVAPPDDTNATDDEVDFHTYDPFESQLSHIDAIRRAVKHDTTSYFARTNARMEKEAEERREAGQPSKTRKFQSTLKRYVANMSLQLELGRSDRGLRKRLSWCWTWGTEVSKNGELVSILIGPTSWQF